MIGWGSRAQSLLVLGALMWEFPKIRGYLRVPLKGYDKGTIRFIRVPLKGSTRAYRVSEK